MMQFVNNNVYGAYRFFVGSLHVVRPGHGRTLGWLPIVQHELNKFGDSVIIQG